MQPWVAGRRQGGALREVGTHWFSALHELFGQGCVERVRARVNYPEHKNENNDQKDQLAEEQVQGEMQLGASWGHAIIKLDVKCKCPELPGEVYELEVQRAGDEAKPLFLHDFTSLSVGTDDGHREVVVANADYGRLECVEELIKAAAGDTSADLVTARHGRNCLRLLDGILNSGGEWVNVEYGREGIEEGKL